MSTKTRELTWAKGDVDNDAERKPVAGPVPC